MQYQALTGNGIDLAIIRRKVEISDTCGEKDVNAIVQKDLEQLTECNRKKKTTRDEAEDNAKEKKLSQPTIQE